MPDEIYLILLIAGAALIARLFIFDDKRARALDREVKQTRRLVKQLKQARFVLSENAFRAGLVNRIEDFVIREKEMTVPAGLLEVYADEITACLPKIFPEIDDLSFNDFTEAYQHIEFRKHLVDYLEVYNNGKASLDALYEVFATKLWVILQTLPDGILDIGDDEAGIAINSPLLEHVQVSGYLVQDLMLSHMNGDLADFAGLRWWDEQLNRNMHQAFRLPADQHWANHMGKVTMPIDAKTSTKEMIDTYLAGLPFQKVLEYPLTVRFPEEARFEHHHILAGSGHGKTQTLQFLLSHDLYKVLQGKASVVVVDSQGDLIRNIKELKFVNEDRLVLIDPTDVEYPVCLNLFDVQMDRINAYSRLHREQMLNGILELYDFVLGSLLGAEMTQKQSVAFRYVTRLLLHIPDATLHTMLELFQPYGTEKYQEHIQKLDGTARIFFEEEFDGSEFRATKKQVVRRLFGILENQTFNRMFSHPRSKLDLFTEMNTGKIILINTAKDLLKEQGTEIFGRFFVAMIAQAAQERATLDASERMPTYVYIDEAQEYFDDNIGIILSQARKYKVGMIMAHQFLDQLSPRLQSAFMANTSIKFAGGVSIKDARALSGEMRLNAETIASQPKGFYSYMIRGHTQQAMTLGIPFGVVESYPKATEAQQAHTLNVMRERYAVHIDAMDDLNREEPENASGDGKDDRKPKASIPKAAKPPKPKSASKKKPKDDGDQNPSDEL